MHAGETPFDIDERISIIAPYLEVVFVRKHGMVFEYMRYLKDGWFES